MRINKDKQLLRISALFAEFSTCISRKVGCVIASPAGHTISTGYNGAPKGCRHPVTLPSELPLSQQGWCGCQDPGRESGSKSETLRCSHAELNAIAQAAYEGVSTKGGTLYCIYSPCSFCAKAIIQAGIVKVVFAKRYTDTEMTNRLLKEAMVEMVLCEMN